jgi:penicillin-binding protein 1A
VFKFINKLTKNQDEAVVITETEENQESPQENPSIDQTEGELANQLLKALKPYKRSKWFWIGVGSLIGLGSGVGILTWGWFKVESSLPKSVDEVLTYTRSGTITIQATDGTVLEELGPVAHEQVKIWEIPDQVINAFIASEDRRFYEHEGVDFQGLMRAVFVNVQSQDLVEGGSTITQQLSRIVFLNQEKSFWRKLREIRLAQKVEDSFDKKVILERYLNLVYLGSGAYGISDAAWTYFGKSVNELTLAEVATIAGITPAPSVYSPFEDLKAAKERRNLVLQRMAEEGFITSAEADQAIASELVTNRQEPKRLQRKIPYFTDFVKQELPKYVTEEQLQAGGLVVETTLDLQWQELAETTVKEAVENYGQGQKFEQASLVAIDPRNGQIKAMVGGKDFEKNQFNRVTQAKRQPGSTFKTFVYAAAIAGGKSPYDGSLDAQYVIDGYRPENYGDTYSGAYLSMRDALVRSINVIAVRTLVDVGWKPLLEVAKKMGIESELKPEYSLALGSSEVTLLELTSAYGTLANQGIHQQAHGISRILDQNGKVLYQFSLTTTPALDPDTSAIMTWMLQGVVNGGTGTNAYLVDRSVAGKTGTSDQSRDLWFIGYIPQIVTGVWLGNDDNSPTWGTSSTAALVWRNFMGKIIEEIPVESFPDLPEISGRKPTIKLEPIKPKSTYYIKPKPQVETTDNNTRSRSNRNSSSNSDSNYSSNRNSSSNRDSSSNSDSNDNSNSSPNRNSNPRPNRNSTPPRNNAPAPAPAPAPSQPSENIPIPVEAPPAPVESTPIPVEPAPEAPTAPLPAPPASRK